MDDYYDMYETDFDGDGEISFAEGIAALNIYNEVTNEAEGSNENSFEDEWEDEDEDDWQENVEFVVGDTDISFLDVDPYMFESKEDFFESLQDAKESFEGVKEEAEELGINYMEYAGLADFLNAVEDARQEEPVPFEENDDFAPLCDIISGSEDDNSNYYDDDKDEDYDEYEDEDEDDKKTFAELHGEEYAELKNILDTVELTECARGTIIDYIEYADLWTNSANESADELDKYKLKRSRFVIKNYTNCLPAKYTSAQYGFLYSQCVKDNLVLKSAVELPSETVNSKITPYDMIDKICRYDISEGLDVWKWCVEQFLPYSEYEDSALECLTECVLSEFGERQMKKAEEYLAQYPDFCAQVFSGLGNSFYTISNMIVELLSEENLVAAKSLFMSFLKTFKDQPETILDVLVEIDGRTDSWNNNIQHCMIDEFLPSAKAVVDTQYYREIDEIERNINFTINNNADYNYFNFDVICLRLNKPEVVENPDAVSYYCGITTLRDNCIKVLNTDLEDIKIGEKLVVDPSMYLYSDAKIIFVGQYTKQCAFYPIEKHMVLKRVNSVLTLFYNDAKKCES